LHTSCLAQLLYHPKSILKPLCAHPPTPNHALRFATIYHLK
jgi:hypothetical protein